METLTAASSDAFTPRSQGRTVTAFSKDQLYRLSADEKQLRELLASRLTPAGHRPGPLIWQDGQAEAIVYVDQLRAAIKPGFIVCELKMETDQSGMASLVLAFKIGSSAGEATLTVTTEALPRGKPALVHRWGAIAQEQLWTALMASGQSLLSQTLHDPELELNGLFSDMTALTFVYGHPVKTDEIQTYVRDIRQEGLDPGEIVFNPRPVDITEPEPGEQSLWQRLCLEWRRLWRQFIRFIRVLVDAAAQKLRQLFG